MSNIINITDLNIPENLRTGDRISCRMGDGTSMANRQIVRIEQEIYGCNSNGYA